MKNGYVLEHHRGDNGTVDEGMILVDMTTQRFAELEKKGLVREATADEVEKGYTPPFRAEMDLAAETVGEPSVPAAKKAPAPANKKAPEPENKGA